MNLKNNKIFILKIVYNKLCNLMKNLENHIYILNKNYILTQSEMNKYNEIIFNLIKKLNVDYNNEINDLSFNMNELQYLDTDNPDILKLYQSQFFSAFFSDIYNEIREIIKSIGYNDIINMVNFYKYNQVTLNNDSINIINEIEDIIIPLSIEEYEVNCNDDYYWRFPNKHNKNDKFEKLRELWLKIDKNVYLKINCYFKIDYLSNKVKTSQINSSYYFNKKNIALKEISKLPEVSIVFIKSFIRHDYLGNIYCMNNKDYIQYLLTINQKYNQYQNMNFISIMKKFVDTTNSNKEIYYIILLLLLGNDDMIDIAGLLIGLIKEKKNSDNHFYNLLYNNLTFYLQSKIKKSNNNLKNNIDSVKKLKIEDIDYKKQLMLNKDIPENIKSLTLEKIEEMKSGNNEYYKQLTYVKTIINYPWSSNNSEYILYNKDKNKAKTYLIDINDKLQKSCYGHNSAKKLLVQTIAKWISNPDSNGTCFGMVGPPGVGKTLLAKSISKVLNIPFGQITLGGQNDGELLHGHGYTYSGSQPGMIVKKMVEMGSSRCILYFDELDKACSKNGNVNEIMSILIHLTDPNMNTSFQDRFFQGVDFPLDKVIFMFSYNDSSLVDPILLDRLTEITVEPYTIEDKLKICKEYILPEMCENIGIDNEVTISNDNMKYLIDSYTAEAGVRGVKRKIEEILLNLNIDKIYQKGIFKSNPDKKININQKIITDILKPPQIERLMIHDKPEIGIINGLYATKSGDGGITPIQVFLNTEQSCNNYEIKLTGKQGDMMKESVYCSLTTAIEYLKENHTKYNIDNLDEHFKNNIKHGFHIHAPSAATPKDGPSAGCAFTSAFISRILNKPIKNNIAMTGEIELTGKISKIGGLEFKLNGAKKAGVNTVYVPKENSNDVDKIKKKYKKLFDDTFEVVIVENIRDLIDDILV